jgi:hypothetical protein
MRTKAAGAAMLMMLGTGLLIQAPGVAQNAPAAGGQITIEGTSTVRKWSCRVAGVIPSVQAGGEAVAGLPKGVQKVVVTIPVQSIDCGNGKMNEHLRKALKAEANPEIRYELKRYTAGDVTRTSGELTIAGTTRPIDLDVGVSALPDGGARVQGEKEIRMTEWGVKPPSLMMGTMKVGDAVKIKFDAPVQPQTTVASSGSTR